jgi:hypothetical protein
VCNFLKQHALFFHCNLSFSPASFMFLLGI